MHIPNSGGETPGRPDPSGELAAIERLRARFEAAARLLDPGADLPPVGEIWIGDDAAAVTLDPTAGGGRLLLATDLVVEGVHFDLAHATAADAGYKALVTTVSDLAAMGARPRYALSSLAGPPGTDLDGLGDGLAEAATRTGCRIVGGDLSEAPVLVVSTAVVGCLSGGGSAPGPLPRAGVRPGDLLFVTGPLGRSAAGLAILSGRSAQSLPHGIAEGLVRAHLRPTARLAEGEAARLAGASAAIDVSDGLATDARNLARASGIGLDLVDIPIANGASRDEALFGGEDYELIVATAEPDRLVAAFDRAGLRAPLPIGRATAVPDVLTLDGRPLPDGGLEHRF